VFNKISSTLFAAIFITLFQPFHLQDNTWLNSFILFQLRLSTAFHWCIEQTMRSSVPHFQILQFCLLIIIWEWPYIHDSPDRLTSTRSGRGLLKVWICWVSFWTGRVIYPSRTESCCSLYSPWWNMCAQRGDRCPLLCPELTCVTMQVSSPRYGAPWYVSNKQLNEDLGFPLLEYHIRALTESLNQS
jgi:hypothetical protein